MGVRTLRCGLYGVLLCLRFLFWPRQLGFWRWRPLWAGDRGAASCGASVPTQPPSAMNGSLRLPARGLPAAGRVAEVSPRAFARCGRPGHVGRFQGFRRLFGLAGSPGCHGASGGDRCAGAGTRDDNPRGYRGAMARAVAPRHEQPPRQGAARAELQQNAEQRGSQGSHRTPLHPLTDPLGPLKTQYNPLKPLLGPPDFGLGIFG